MQNCRRGEEGSNLLQRSHNSSVLEGRRGDVLINVTLQSSRRGEEVICYHATSYCRRGEEEKLDHTISY